MDKKIPSGINRASVIFLIVGILTLFSVISLTSGSRMIVNKSGISYIALLGSMGATTMFPENAVPVFLIFSVAFIVESLLLFKLVRAGFWIGVILSIPMLLSFPIGTLIGAYLIYSISHNASAFSKKSC